MYIMCTFCFMLILCTVVIMDMVCLYHERTDSCVLLKDTGTYACPTRRTLTGLPACLLKTTGLTTTQDYWPHHSAQDYWPYHSCLNTLCWQPTPSPLTFKVRQLWQPERLTRSTEQTSTASLLLCCHRFDGEGLTSLYRLLGLKRHAEMFIER